MIQIVYHLQPWLDVARWRCVNAPDGLATYWAHALLITLQGTREETTLRAHTSVVLLYACCWSCISALFECVWRATPQPCLRVVHTGYVLPVAYVMLHIWGAVIAYVQFSSFPIVTTLPEGNVGHETALSTDLGTDPKNSMAFSCPCFCIINAYLCFVRYLVHLFVCAIVFCWGVSRATFLTECGGNLPCLVCTHWAHFLREVYLTFYLVNRLKTSIFSFCLACAQD